MQVKTERRPVHTIARYARIRVRRVDLADVGPLSGALARAFHDDPVPRYLLPDEEQRRRVLPEHFANLVRYYALYRQGFTDDDQDGAALWWKPGDTEATLDRLQVSGLARTPELAGEDAFLRLMRFVRFLGEIKERCMTAPHWYLSTLGVEPERQGQGIGGGLMQNVFERADSDGVPCYLETQKESNVRFYEGHGFRVLADDVHPESGIPVWTMRRDPREPA